MNLLMGITLAAAIACVAIMVLAIAQGKWGLAAINSALAGFNFFFLYVQSRLQ